MKGLLPYNKGLWSSGLLAIKQNSLRASKLVVSILPQTEKVFAFIYRLIYARSQLLWKLHSQLLSYTSSFNVYYVQNRKYVKSISCEYPEYHLSQVPSN